MITYLIGDATHPIGDGHKVIAHVCNDLGGWGAGFVLALDKVSFNPHRSYVHWAREGYDFELGAVQYVPIFSTTTVDNITVANMVAQRGYKGPDNPRPLSYSALVRCLIKVGHWAKLHDASVHMPRIGCGLGGGDWNIVSKQIEAVIHVPTFVYDLP